MYGPVYRGVYRGRGGALGAQPPLIKNIWFPVVIHSGPHGCWGLLEFFLKHPSLEKLLLYAPAFKYLYTLLPSNSCIRLCRQISVYAPSVKFLYSPLPSNSCVRPCRQIPVYAPAVKYLYTPLPLNSCIRLCRQIPVYASVVKFLCTPLPSNSPI